MGRRGPAPTPSAILERRGEQHLDRLNRMEPLPRRGPPRMPPGILPDAIPVWRRVLRDSPPNVIAAADTDVLRCFCEAVALYELSIKTMGTALIVKSHGDLVKTPLHQVVRDHREAVRLFARELGLSPSARTGLRVDLSATPGDLHAEIGLPPRLRVVGGGDE